MKTPISSKIAAFAVALMMNSLVLGAMVYLFSVRTPSQAAEICQSQLHASVFRWLI
jgi:hypothetical protein